MFRRFWGRIFREIDKFLVGSIGVVFVLLVYTILPNIIPSSSTIPFWVIQLILLACFLVCILIYAVCKTKNEGIEIEPLKIRTYTENLLILDPHAHIQVGTLLSIVYCPPNGEYEQRVALAEVYNIQTQNKLIQVRILDSEHEFMKNKGLTFTADANWLSCLRVSTFVNKSEVWGYNKRLAYDEILTYLKSFGDSGDAKEIQEQAAQKFNQQLQDIADSISEEGEIDG